MQKIASEEAWNSFVAKNNIEVRELRPDWLGVPTYSIPGKGNVFDAPWWALREKYRMAYVYTTTSITDWLNKQAYIFSHVSTEDNNMVAYTYDAASGEADRQTRTTIGKLLQKFCPLLTQAHIQELSAQHLAEANPIVEFCSGHALTKAYIEDLGGLGSCMSKQFPKHHPTEAYHTPHIQLAVCKTLTGNVIGRTLVYTNGSDKRYTRVYGTVIGKALERMGYVNKDFTGVQLNTVVLDKTKQGTRVVVPYIDSAKGRATSESSSVTLIDGVLTILTTAQKNSLDYSEYKLANTADGYLWLENINTTDFEFTCPLSEVTVNTFVSEVETLSVMYKGKKVKAIADAVPRYYVSAVDKNRDTVNVHPEDCLITDNNRYLCMSPKDAHSLGYRQLSSKYYESVYSKNTEIDINGDVVSAKDTFAVYIGFTRKYVHKSVFNPKDYIKCHEDIYCTKDTAYVVTTSEKKVIPSVHFFYTDIHGVHTLRRPKYQTNFNNVTYYAQNKEELDAYIAKAAFVLLQKAVQEADAFHFRVAMNRLQQKSVGWENHASRAYYKKMPEVMAMALEHLELGNPVRSYIAYTLADMNAVDFN